MRLSDAALAMVGLPAEAVARPHPQRERACRPRSSSRSSASCAWPSTRARSATSSWRCPPTTGCAGCSCGWCPTARARCGCWPATSPLRKHAELRLTGGHAAFRALVEDSPDPVARVDADLRIGFVNSAFERAAGRAGRGLPGPRRSPRRRCPAEVAERWEDGVRSVFERGERLAVDFRFAGRGRRALVQRPPAAGARPRRRRSSTSSRAFTDITDRVNQEAEQAALRRVATVVAREGDLEEIGRVVAEEATLLLGATGQRGLPLRVARGGDLRGRAPAGRRGRRSSPPPCRSAARPRRACTATDRRGRARGRLPRRCRADASVEQVLEAGLRSGIAAPLCDRRPGVGRADRGLEPSRARSGRPRSGAWRPSPSSRRSPWPTPRRAPSWPAWPRPTRSPGLANRRAFTKRLSGEVERARRHGHLLTLVILDLDDFKGINDTHGHQVGDRVLAEVGRQLWRPRRAPASWSRASAARSSPGSSPRSTRPGAMAPVERARARIAGIRVDGVSGITCSAGVCDLTRGARRRRAAAPRRPGPLQRQARRARPRGGRRPLTGVGPGGLSAPAALR